MKPGLKENFLVLWESYFGEAELPIAFYYSEGIGGAEQAEKPGGRSCLICELGRVRSGISLAYNAGSVTCTGGKRYLGFTDQMRPGFEYFLSCGNEQMEGERYKQSPELVGDMMKQQQHLHMENKNIVFKRWDKLETTDEPEVVIFFATPDVLSGLFTLANFDQAGPNGAFTPFSAGCGSIVHHPYLETRSESPRAVIGMFDPSARPCVQDNILTFALPMKRFEQIIGFMKESFLVTPTWTRIRKRIAKSKPSEINR